MPERARAEAFADVIAHLQKLAGTPCFAQTAVMGRFGRVALKALEKEGLCRREGRETYDDGPQLCDAQLPARF